ncbi:unnamed protein product [Amaranthus hypochondriacus]
MVEFLLPSLVSLTFVLRYAYGSPFGCPSEKAGLGQRWGGGAYLRQDADFFLLKTSLDCLLKVK